MGAFDSSVRLLPPGAVPTVQALGWPALLESLPEAAWLVEGRGLTVVAANDRAHALIGKAPGSLLGQSAESLVFTPEDLVYWDEASRGLAGVLHSEATLGLADGRSLHVSRSVRPFAHGEAGQTYYLVMLTDLSERHAAEDRLEQALSELQATLESTADGILVTDLGGHIRAFNRRFAEIWGLPQQLLDARDDQAVHDWLRRSVEDSDAYERRLRALVNATLASATDTLTLHSRQIIERVTQPLWQRGRPMGRVYAFRDVSDRVAADRRIVELSQTDPLTGLPHRGELSAAVERAVADLHHGGSSFALMLVDLDRFSNINETLGSSRADLVLLEVTRRLRAAMRQGDMIARVGGDQFALLVHHADPAAAEITARRVLDAIAVPSSLDGMQFTLTCSIGVAVSPIHGRGLDELMNNAGEAMRRAKGAGRASWRLHTMRREADLRTSMRMDHAMRQALAHQRFRLHYQPQVDLRSGQLVGAEALLRWRDPEFGGDVSPARFIPVAEESGLIISIGAWVMAEAVRQAARWRAKGFDVPVAVNVSALQFQQPDFIEQVAKVLDDNGLPPEALELEVTETILIHDAEDMLTRLNALSRLGVRLSIDDFGTGYSSLAYLKRFPIDQVKIDRSFVAGLPADDSDAGIVKAILQMARALGMGVIAEGVENQGQHDFLRDAGCTRFQGYHFSPAVDAARFEERWLAPSVPLLVHGG
ncbi:MAG: EAL domain-containing protein [Rubrivivax sp.]|nr:EAL domain-containing protein [Rubrivivax sp.]